jgi:hypothetical protein
MKCVRVRGDNGVNVLPNTQSRPLATAKKMSSGPREPKSVAGYSSTEIVVTEEMMRSARALAGQSS